MKICLINAPDFQSLDPKMDPPFHLLYLASAIRQRIADAEIEIIDSGASMPDIPEADIYGISSVTPTYFNVKYIIEDIYSANPDAKIILGGIHVSALPDFNLPVDSIIKGECEANIEEVITSIGLIQGIPPKSLDWLHPLPWHLINMKDYIGHRGGCNTERSITLMVSRGCPFRCNFCRNAYQPNKYRFLSADKLQEELQLLKREYNITELFFVDDLLPFKKYSPVLSQIDLPWGGLFRADMLTKDNRQILSKTSCKYVRIGIESGSQRLLDLMNKKQDIEQCRQIIKECKQDFEVHVYLLIGYPGETDEDINKTINFLKDTRPDVARMSLFMPFPSTLAYHHPAEFNIKNLSKNWYDYANKGRKKNSKELFKSIPYIYDNVSKKQLRKRFLKVQNAAKEYCTQQV